MTSAATASDELVREARSRYEADRLALRARVAYSIAALAVAGGALACALALPTGPAGALWKAALFVAVYAFASRADFEIGIGSALPTALVFVPMLFVLPLGLVPAVVALGPLLGTAVEDPRAFREPARVLPLVGSAAYAFGPVLVLQLAGGLPFRWSHWPIYLAALAAQFALDLAAGLVGNFGNGVRPATVVHLISYAWAVDAALAPAGLGLAAATIGHVYLITLVVPLVGLLRIFASERSKRIDSALELSDAYRGTAFLLGDVIEAEDEYTGSHSRHVVRLVGGVAKALRLGAEDLRNAEFAALLHDVGKITIPHAILTKPGPLTSEERAVMETHAVEGERLLQQVGGLLGEVGRVVRSCHERWDGGGYPDRLAGEQIPLVSRIVSACDAYSAMTTDRPYRAALPDAQALAELERCAGTQFDPRVVEALLGLVSAAG